MNDYFFSEWCAYEFGVAVADVVECFTDVFLDFEFFESFCDEFSFYHCLLASCFSLVGLVFGDCFLGVVDCCGCSLRRTSMCVRLVPVLCLPCLRTLPAKCALIWSNTKSFVFMPFDWAFFSAEVMTLSMCVHALIG